MAHTWDGILPVNLLWKNSAVPENNTRKQMIMHIRTIRHQKKKIAYSNKNTYRDPSEGPVPWAVIQSTCYLATV